MNQQKRDVIMAFFAIMFGVTLFAILTSEIIYAMRFWEENGWTMLFFFTNQSNYLVSLWLIAFGITRFKGANSKFGLFITNRAVMTAVTLYITMTFLVVLFVLAPFFLGHFWFGIVDSMFFTHLLTPVVMWIFFFFVSGQGTVKLRHTFLFLVYPLLYLPAGLLLGYFGPQYFIYDFLDPSWYPHPSLFAVMIIGLALAFWGVGLGLAAFKKYLTQENNKLDFSPS